MTRHAQWEQRLLALIEKHRARPYEFGQWDCLLFPAAVAKAVIGKDHGKVHRGKYNSFASAYAYLKRIGFDSPEALLDSLFDEKPVGFAQRGDFVLTNEGIPALCMGAFAFGIGEGAAGLIRIPRTLWAKAWRVG